MDYHKVTEPIMDSVNRLRKDFEDFRAGNQVNRELEIKNQLFSELIRKSEDKMREEIQGVLRKMSEVNPKSISSFSDERLEEFEKVVRKIDKGLALNSGKIAGAYERIEAISSSIDGHMDLVNT
jgi:DNA anti-recombination protein RmuC